MSYFQLVMDDKYLYMNSFSNLDFHSFFRKRNKTFFSKGNCIKPNLYKIYNLYEDSEIEMKSYYPLCDIFLYIKDDKAYFQDVEGNNYKLSYSRFIKDNNVKSMNLVNIDENDFTYNDYILKDSIFENRMIEKIQEEYSNCLNKGIEYCVCPDLLINCMNKKRKYRNIGAIKYLITNSKKLGINLDYCVIEKYVKKFALSKALYNSEEICNMLILNGAKEYDSEMLKTSIIKNIRIDFFVKNYKYDKNDNILFLLIKHNRSCYITKELILMHKDILNDFYFSPVIELVKNIENNIKTFALFLNNGLNCNFTFFLQDRIYSLYSYLKSKKLEYLLQDYNPNKELNHELYYNFLKNDYNNKLKEDLFISKFPLSKDLIFCMSNIYGLNIDKNYYEKLSFRKIFLNQSNYDIICYISEFL